MSQLAGKRSIHSQAVDSATDDMQKVIKSFDDEPFMGQSVSDRTKKRHELLANAAPDLQQMLSEGMPMSLVEKLARMDLE